MTRHPLTTTVAIDDPADAQTVLDALADDGDFAVLALASTEEERGAALAQHAEAFVLGCDGDVERSESLIAAAVAAQPERAVVVVTSRSPNGMLGRLFAAGADDVVVLPETPQRVAFAIEKAVARKRRSTATETGRLVAVLGPKGGTGKTFVSANLAVALARAGRRSSIVDVDLQFGDVALTLGLEPRRTLYDLARSGSTLDAGKLDGFAMPHRSGLRTFVAPLRPDEAAAVGIDLLGHVYETLRTVDDFVVVDTPAGFPPEVIATIDAATDLVLVGTLDAGSLKDSKLGLEALTLMGHDPAQVRLVLNRADSIVGVEPRDVERIFGRAPDVLVPSDRAVPRSINEGVPLVESEPRSGAAQAIQGLADLILADGAGATVAPPRRRHHPFARRHS